jgi:allantoin racemase
MTIRIAVLGSGTRSSEMPAHLLELAVAGVQAELITSRVAGFASNPYDRLVVDVAYVEMAQRAEAAGCDAVFINTYADYGIEAMRSAVRIPVIGAGEAAMTAAAMPEAASVTNECRRFSIVTVWPPSMKFLYDERTRMTAAGAHCASVRHISPEDELARLTSADGVQQRMGRREAAIIDRVVAECEHAVREDGAQAIVLGCTCMAPIGPAVAARCTVPVIESSRAGFRAAVAAVRAGSKLDARKRTERPTLIPAIVDAYVGIPNALPDSTGATREECPVCL